MWLFTNFFRNQVCKWPFGIFQIQKSFFKVFLSCCCSVGRLCLTLKSHVLQDARLLCLTVSLSLLKLTSIESVMPKTISSSVTSFFPCPQSFPASGSFPMSQLFSLGGQSIGASASLLPMNIQGWSPLGLIDLLALPGTLKSLFQHHNSKASILWCSAFFMAQLSHPCKTTGKTIALTIWTFVGKVISLLLNTLYRSTIAVLPRGKCLLISWLLSLSAVLLGPKKIKSVTVSTFSPSICYEVMGLDAKIFVLWMLNFKPAFSLSSFTLINRLFK